MDSDCPMVAPWDAHAVQDHRDLTASPPSLPALSPPPQVLGVTDANDGAERAPTPVSSSVDQPAASTDAKAKAPRKRRVFSPPPVRMTWRNFQMMENKQKEEEAKRLASAEQAASKPPVKVQVKKAVVKPPSKKLKTETQSKTPKQEVDKNEEKKTRKSKEPLAEHIEESLNYFTAQAIESIYVSKDAPIMTAAERVIVEKYITENAFKDDYLEVDFPMDGVFPDKENYRGLLTDLTQGLTQQSATIHRKLENRPRRMLFPPLRLTGKLHVNPATVSGSEVVEKAKNWSATRVNEVYDTNFMAKLPSGNSEIVELDRELFSNVANGALKTFDGIESNRLAIPIITVNNLSEAMGPRLKNLVTSASIVMIRGLGKTIELDFDLFDIKTLAAKQPKSEMIVIRQMPQSVRQNKDVETGKNQWVAHRAHGTMKMEEFGRKYSEFKSAVSDSLQNAGTTANFEKSVQKLKDTIQKTQTASLSRKIDSRVAWATFGTNINVETKQYPAQANEMVKFPEFMRPTGPNTLLTYTDEVIAGLNGVQVYVKPPGVRTVAHLENSGMDSININLGPGDCVWYSIPLEFSGKMESFLKRKGLTVWNSIFWPDEEELLKAGIPVQKFLQKPDDTVYVGTGTWHWVQSNGFCTNIAWNVAQPTIKQLAIIALVYDHCETAKSTDMQTLVAIEQMVWNLAKKQMYLTDAGISNFVKASMIRSLANVQFELNWLQTQNVQLMAKDECSAVKIPTIIRCYGCQKVIFNVFVTRQADESQMLVFCTHCATKPDSKNQVGKDNDQYFYQHAVEELVKTFDSYRIF